MSSQEIARQLGAGRAQLLSAKEVATLISVDEETVRRWEAAGRLPAALRISRGWTRWRKSDIELWVSFGCPPREEFETRKRVHEARGGG